MQRVERDSRKDNRKAQQELLEKHISKTMDIQKYEQLIQDKEEEGDEYSKLEDIRNEYDIPYPKKLIEDSEKMYKILVENKQIPEIVFKLKRYFEDQMLQKLRTEATIFVPAVCNALHKRGLKAGHIRLVAYKFGHELGIPYKNVRRNFPDYVKNPKIQAIAKMAVNIREERKRAKKGYLKIIQKQDPEEFERIVKAGAAARNLTYEEAKEMGEKSGMMKRQLREMENEREQENERENEQEEIIPPAALGTNQEIITFPHDIYLTQSQWNSAGECIKESPKQMCILTLTNSKQMYVKGPVS